MSCFAGLVTLVQQIVEILQKTCKPTNFPFKTTVKPALVTTSIQRPPLFKDHLAVSQLWLYHAFLPLLRDHFFWPKRGRLIQVSLYPKALRLSFRDQTYCCNISGCNLPPSLPPSLPPTHPPTSPSISFSSVDLPAPLGPTRATRVSKSIPNSMFL